MNLVLATRNPGKVEQIKGILAGLPLLIQSMTEAGIIGEAVEDCETLDDNAYLKALFVYKQKKAWCVADDSGIFIDALDGRPGVHSARWAGEHATPDEIVQYTLEQMKHVTKLEDRTAVFATLAVVISPRRQSRSFVGQLRGTILHEAQGLCKPGMPYDPIFVPEGYNKTLLEMTLEERVLIDHRGKAFLKVRDMLKTTLL